MSLGLLSPSGLPVWRGVGSASLAVGGWWVATTIGVPEAASGLAVAATSSLAVG